VWHLALPLMNSFNKTEAAIFTLQAMLPEGFPFISLVQTYSFKYIYFFIIWQKACQDTLQLSSVFLFFTAAIFAFERINLEKSIAFV